MSETKHTPGPWRSGNTSDTVVCDTMPAGALQGSDAVDYYGGYLICESVATCNRNIIAAAPDMLAALRAVDLWIAHHDGEIPSRILDQVSDAIVKAEGGER
ncbi:MAG: hypothetical protein JW942_06875 [Opitutales bacterium]|nr:hypothetical protein [Opitutales bacterium]